MFITKIKQTKLIHNKNIKITFHPIPKEYCIHTMVFQKVCGKVKLKEKDILVQKYSEVYEQIFFLFGKIHFPQSS